MLREIGRVCSAASVAVVDDPAELDRSPKRKPFLRVVFDDGTVVEMTTNLAEMIGGAGAGLRMREEDKKKR